MVEAFDLQGGQVSQDEAEAACGTGFGFTLVSQHGLVLIPARHLRVCNKQDTHLGIFSGLIVCQF